MNQSRDRGSQELCVRGEGLTKRFGPRVLFENLDFALQPAAMTALVGPSGSGKSTLLNIVGRLEDADAGRLWWGDLELTGLSRRAERLYRRDIVGYLFQNYSLIESASVRENLAVVTPVGLFRRGITEDAMAQALAQVGLEGRLDSEVAHLSGGEQQRVAVARLLLKKPQLVLADEPTGALDEANAALVVDLLRGFAENGATVLVATHSAEVAAASDAVLDLGDTARHATRFGRF